MNRREKTDRIIQAIVTEKKKNHGSPFITITPSDKDQHRLKEIPINEIKLILDWLATKNKILQIKTLNYGFCDEADAEHDLRDPVSIDIEILKDFDLWYKVYLKKKSNKHSYETRDVLTFIERDERKAGHIVKVNKGKEFCIPYACSGLLLLMAFLLKENQEGWVTKDRVKKDGLIVQKEGNDQQRLMALVNKLRPNFKKKVNNIYSFIETWEGRYRLSTDPSNIQGKDRRWLKQEYEMILNKRKADKKKDNLGQGKESQPKQKSIMVPIIQRDLK